MTTWTVEAPSDAQLDYIRDLCRKAEQAYDTAVELLDRLRERYPHSSENGVSE